MPAPRPIHLALLLTTAVALFVTGCGDSSPTSPKPGTITITATPADLEPGWTLTGPNAYERTGTGNETFTDLVPGDYTLAWQAIAGWLTPDTSTATLSTEGEITFAGAYMRVPATTADEAMAAFHTAYAGRDLGSYEYLLGADFRFIDQNDGSQDRTQEIAIADAMFHEQPGDNGLVISNIAIDLLQPQSTWSPTPANDPNFGAFNSSQYRQYLVDIKFAVADQNLILRVQGPVLFYTMGYPENDGVSYKLLGMVDATYGHKATEDHSWTGVRSLFE